mmetsp:Transcript_68605/g.134725  ORF Transcript_68605/g.134725 Transcript_68605/m.134725 type:complete len:218 (+) Transcript_68605:195-848(+)
MSTMSPQNDARALRRKNCEAAPTPSLDDSEAPADDLNDAADDDASRRTSPPFLSPWRRLTRLWLSWWSLKWFSRNSAAQRAPQKGQKRCAPVAVVVVAWVSRRVCCSRRCCLLVSFKLAKVRPFLLLLLLWLLSVLLGRSPARMAGAGRSGSGGGGGPVEDDVAAIAVPVAAVVVVVVVVVGILVLVLWEQQQQREQQRCYLVVGVVVVVVTAAGRR